MAFSFLRDKEPSMRFSHAVGWPKKCEHCDRLTHKRYGLLFEPRVGRATVACCATHAVLAQWGKRQREKETDGLA